MNNNFKTLREKPHNLENLSSIQVKLYVKNESKIKIFQKSKVS